MQFEALRGTLKTTAADLVARYRELGCTAVSVASAPSPGAATGRRLARAYQVALLPAQGPGMLPKTLGECFPRLKLPISRRK